MSSNDRWVIPSTMLRQIRDLLAEMCTCDSEGQQVQHREEEESNSSRCGERPPHPQKNRPA